MFRATVITSDVRFIKDIVKKGEFQSFSGNFFENFEIDQSSTPFADVPNVFNQGFLASFYFSTNIIKW